MEEINIANFEKLIIIVCVLETMEKLKLLGLLLICGLLSACTGKEKTDIFSKVEGYMELYPDSALWLLNQIPHPEKLHGKQRADYALLLTQAQDKNYLDSLQSDSLIKFAVDYYKDGDDRVKAGKAFLYYGKVLDLKGKEAMAMQVYLDAQTALEKTKEYKLLALVQQYMGSLNSDRKMYDMALDNYRRSVSYSKKTSDTLKMIYSYRNIAWIYEIKQNYDSAAWFAKTAMSLLKEDSLSSIFPSLSHFLGEQENRKKNYNEAITYFNSAIKYEKIPRLVYYYNLSLGNAYLQLGQLEQAKARFNDAVTSKDIYTQSGAYNYLYLLEKKCANYAKSLSYKEKSDSLLSISKDRKLQDEIFAIQQKYETDKLMMENRLLAQEKQIQLYILLLVSVLLVALGVILYKVIKKQYRKIYKKRLKKRIEKELRTYEENELAIRQYVLQIEELKQREVLSIENAREKIGKLNQKIQILVNENKEIRENFGVSAPYLLSKLKKGLLLVENMTPQEKLDIFEYIDLLSGNFATQLQESYKLNENNLLLAVLTKLGFSIAELCIAFDCEETSIYKKRQRLKKQLKLGKKNDLDMFLSQRNPLYLSAIKDHD